MLLFNRFTSQGVFESENQLVSSLSRDGTRLAIITDQGQLQIISCSISSVESFGQRLLSCDLNWSPVNLPVFLDWSNSGTKIVVGLSDGRIQVFSSLGVSLNLFDFAKQLTSIRSLQFFSDGVILVATGNEKLFGLNIMESKLNLLSSLNRYHTQLRIQIAVEREMVICSGLHPHSGQVNISVWKLSPDLQSCVLLESLLEPVSRFWSWMGRSSFKQQSCSLCLSPNGSQLAVLTQNSPPLVFNRSESGLTRFQIDPSVLEVLETAKEGCYWSDSVFAVSTQIGKIVFLQIQEQVVLLDSEDAVEGVQFIGYLPTGGVLFVESSESRTLKKLICLKQETPAEHMETLIRKQEFSAALELAETAGFSKEAVYKEMWNQKSYSSISCSELTPYFENIVDVEWTINVCLSITGESLQDQEQILKHGLEELRKNMNLDNKKEQYLTLLKQLEMLFTFKALHPGSYSWKAFNAFRKESTLFIAKAFAQNCNLRAIQVLFKFQAWTLFPHLLEIVQNLPATMHPKETSRIYPSMGLTPDLMKFTPCLDHELLDPLKPYDQLVQGQDSLSILPNQILMELDKTGNVKIIEPFSELELQDFYLKESDRIEAETGDLEHSRQVLEYGLKKGIKTGELQTRIQQLRVFQLWMKTGTLKWDLTSSCFSRLTTLERIQSCLDSVSDSQVMEVLTEVLIPLASELPTVGEKTEFQTTLLHYLLVKDILFFEELISLECANGALFGDSVQGSRDFLRSVMTVIKSVKKCKNWKILTESLDLIVKQVTLLTRDEDEIKDPALTEGQNLLEICQIGEILGKYGITVEYARINDLEHSDGLKFIKSVLSHAMRNGRHWTESRWEDCHSDIIKISNKTPSMESGILHQEFFQTLLRSGQFQTARNFSGQNLDSEIAEDISWKIGHEMMCSLNDLADSISVKETIDCLSLFPDSKRSKSEIRKLKALSFLNDEFGVCLLPVELEQLQSKAEIVHGILEASQDHYLQREAISRISMELKFTNEEILESWKLLCRTALQQKDLLEAKTLIQELEDRNIKQSWILALEVLEANKQEQILKQDQEQELWILVISNSDQNLQDHLHQMYPAFPDLEFDYAEFFKNEKFPSCDDVLFYCLDEDWRQQIRTQQDFSMTQKWRVYDFVHQILNSVENRTPEDSNFVRSLLESSPSSMKSQLELSGIDYEGLKLNWEALIEQDHLQGNFQQIQTLLPALEASRFHRDGDYRNQVILELAKYAAELLYLQERPKHENRGANWEEVWSLALEQGSKFGIESWELYCHFGISLIALIDCPFSNLELVMESLEDTLKSRRSQYIQELLNEAWDQLTSVYGVAFGLRIIQRMTHKTGSQFLSNYASCILEWDAEFDFRVPVFLPLTEFVNQEFGVRFSWSSAVQEQELVFQNIELDNIEEFWKLYSILEEHSSSMEVDCSRLTLICVIKELIRDPWSPQLFETSFWKTLISKFSDPDLTDLTDFLVFQKSSNLSNRMKRVGVKVIQSLREWSPASREHSKLTKVFLETILELLEGTSRLEEELMSWKKELKRVKIKIASQSLEGMESIITSDDLNENLHRFIRKLFLDGKTITEVFQSVHDFCQSSEEEISSAEILDHIKESIKPFNHEDEVLIQIDCGDSPSSEEQEMVTSIQQEIWNSFLDQLRAIEDPSEVERTKLEYLMRILQREVWGNRQWEIQSTDCWLLFSWDVFLKLQSLDGLSFLSRDCLNSNTALEVKLMERLFEDQIPSETVYSILEVLQKTGSTVIGEELDIDWFSAYYFRTFMQDFARGDFDSIMSILCQTEVPVLTLSDGGRLFKKMEDSDPKLAASVGLLLPHDNLQDRVEALVKSTGDAQTLAVLLDRRVKIKISGLLESASWLIEILQDCPPHPVLFQEWNEEQETTGKQEEPQKDQDSVDGWDFDSEEEKNEQEVDSEGGWSEVDELETALEAMKQPEEHSQKESESLKVQDSRFIGSCCFVLVLGKLVEENRKDLAAELASEKFNLHHEMYRLSGGEQLLKKFLSKQASSDSPVLEDYGHSISYLWSKDVIKRLLSEWTPNCRRALDLLEDSSQ